MKMGWEEKAFLGRAMWFWRESMHKHNNPQRAFTGASGICQGERSQKIFSRWAGRQEQEWDALQAMRTD